MASVPSPDRLVLGTAQLGFNYGIANRTGKPGDKMAREIVSTAWELGIREFDTAQGYGDSERVLGGCLADLGLQDEARVTTKITLPDGPDLPSQLGRCVAVSLERLRVPRLRNLLLHREHDLRHLDGPARRAWVALQEQGLTEGLGVSVYSVASALRALRLEAVDCLQLSANVLDRRFARAGVFELAREKGARIYVRSVFLQGLLLMDPDDLPGHLADAREALLALKALCADFGLSRQSFCLSWAASRYPDATLVIGAESPEQVRENCYALGNLPSEAAAAARRAFEDVSEKILNPSLWATA